MGCKGLTSVTIPQYVKSIEKKLFSGCKSLQSINVNIYSVYFKSIDGVLFDDYTLIEYPEGRNGPYVTPENTLIINSEAFKGCSGLTAITITPMVQRIGIRAFEGCDNLEVVSHLGSYNPFKGDEDETVFDPCNIDEIAAVVRIIEIREVSAHYE